MNIYEEIFEELDKRDLKYVIWKSLENIDNQLIGKDDVDILVNTEISKLDKILKSNYFFDDFLSDDTFENRIKIYRGFNIAKNKWQILHIHYGLWIGSKKYKQYLLGNADYFLNNKIIYKKIKILDHYIFIYIRIILIILKNDFNDLFIKNYKIFYNKLSSEQKKI